MQFFDEKLSALDAAKPKDFLILIGFLRGDLYTLDYSIEINPYVERHSEYLDLLGKIVQKKDKIGYEQINEILLIFNKSRISQGFFLFFFVPEHKWLCAKGFSDNTAGRFITWDEFKQGVIKFRGMAMLKYGNFRYGHKHLRNLTLANIIEALGEFARPSGDLKKCYSQQREEKALDIGRIERDNTWLVGYLSAQDLKEDLKLAYALIKRISPKNFNNTSIMCELRESEIDAEDIDQLAVKLENSFIMNWEKRSEQLIRKIESLKKQREQVIEKARINTEIYLTWDFMDVYVATSMRNNWEFEAAWDFMENVFYNGVLSDWNLRFFDPTQSFTRERLNKGLVESLMLKRARATIYLVQEIDSLGKDSELAATLAQGKPVIAFVPEIRDEEIPAYAAKLEKKSLTYFWKRYLGLTLERTQNTKKAFELFPKYLAGKVKNIEDKFRLGLWDYFNHPRFLTDSFDERDFKESGENRFADMCTFLTILESVSYDKRADILKKFHPLALQVNLSTGVANGILVARSYQECVKLISRILTNDVEYEIDYSSDLDIAQNKPNNLRDLRKGSVVLLKEKLTGCPHRVVTGDEKITNSFWNFYLEKEHDND